MPQLSYNAQTAAALPPQMYTGYAYGSLPQTGGDFAARGVAPTYSPEVQAYLAQREAYAAAHPELGILSGFELTAPAGRGGGLLQATDAQIRQYMNTPLEQQFVPTSGGGGFAVRPDAGVRIIDHRSGETIFQGVGPAATDQAHAITQQINEQAGHNADWAVDIQNPDGTWTTAGRNIPEINKLGAFADVALPLALSLAVPGLGILGGSLGSALGAAGGTALSGIAQGRGIEQIALSSALSGLGAYAGGELLGGLSPEKPSLSNLGIDWSGIRDAAAAELAGEIGGSAIGGAAGGSAADFGSDIVVNAVRQAVTSAAPGAFVGGALGGAGGSLAVLGNNNPPPQLEVDPSSTPPQLEVDPITVTGRLPPPPNLAVENFVPGALGPGLSVGIDGGTIDSNTLEVRGQKPEPEPNLAVSVPMYNGQPVPEAPPGDDVVVNAPTDPRYTTAPPAIDFSGIRDVLKFDPPTFDDLQPLTPDPPSLAIDPTVFDTIDPSPSSPPEGAPEGPPTVVDPFITEVDPFITETENPNDLIKDIIKALVIGGGLTGVGGNLGGGGNGAIPPGLLGNGMNPIFSNPLPPPVIPGVGDPSNLGPRAMTAQDWLRYGMRPEQSFFNYVPPRYTPPLPGVMDPAWDRIGGNG